VGETRQQKTATTNKNLRRRNNETRLGRIPIYRLGAYYFTGIGAVVKKRYEREISIKIQNNISSTGEMKKDMRLPEWRLSRKTILF